MILMNVLKSLLKESLFGHATERKTICNKKQIIYYKHAIEKMVTLM